MKFYRIFLITFFISYTFPVSHLFAKSIKTDLLIIGGGASGTTAAIQASRMGINTLLVEETEWLGGMLTAAGVSAIDGNHKMPAGLWGEFREKLYEYYGGPKEVETGWVSNTLFEPHVGNKILKELASNEHLSIWHKAEWESVKREGDKWLVTIKRGRKEYTVETTLIIDATELGDIAAAVGVEYRIGMDSNKETGERYAPVEANDIVQDLTYVVILEDFGDQADKTIAVPPGYNPEDFQCACDTSDPSEDSGPVNDCEQMIRYGKLPNNKYMINWPKCGNDIYLNIIEDSKKERKAKLEEAKLHTLRFVYYLQNELGFKNLGIASDEFPTSDNFPMIPYHRESRRIEGLVDLTVNHLENPFEQEDPLYRTGIAVGDYPIDHHHLKNPKAPEIPFIKIKVPSYNVPLGTLIPQDIDGLIVAEKSISVSNIVNGATRLQPVVLQIGQAAGALAAICIQNDVKPSQASVRKVQQALLDDDAYLMPYIDVAPKDPNFQAIQRIGATGILRGDGVPYKWANQTWFYPEAPENQYNLIMGLIPYFSGLENFSASGERVSLDYMLEIFKTVVQDSDLDINSIAWDMLNIAKPASSSGALDRRSIAVLIDHFLNPFAVPINFEGHIIEQGN